MGIRWRSAWLKKACIWTEVLGADTRGKINSVKSIRVSFMITAFRLFVMTFIFTTENATTNLHVKAAFISLK